METSKEELPSINEELQTVNAELSSRAESLQRSNSDLNNLFESTPVATLFLDGGLRIRRTQSNVLITADTGEEVWLTSGGAIADVLALGKLLEPGQLPRIFNGAQLDSAG